jgi:metal-dependent amidase/aminoacylase/carboxypeptidase family protein
VDPIVCAATCVSSLQTVISRNVSYADPAVLSVCFLHGGEAFNVIPDTCRFGGTIRDLSPAVFDTIKQRLTTIGTAHASPHTHTAHTASQRR